jgi:RNA polymerase sigma factor for flagellar operon FliA
MEAIEDKIEDVLKQYEPLVRSKAYAIYSKFNKQQCNILLDDLYQAGRLGIVEAYNTYDPERGVPFVAFVTLRVTFAIYAEMTTTIQYERHAAKFLQNLQADRRNAELVYGRDVTYEEVADFTGECEQAFLAKVKKHQGSVPWVVSFDGLQEESSEEVPHKSEERIEDAVYHAELKGIISKCWSYLTSIERRVVKEAFFKNQSLEKIGLSLGVSKQRVFTIRERALSKIRKFLEQDGFVWPGANDEC